ncbi:MAG: hypothetical protein AVDCRST_MAG40-3412, partial [uncultured Gemmatimonadaceae bacterium]
VPWSSTDRPGSPPTRSPRRRAATPSTSSTARSRGRWRSTPSRSSAPGPWARR